MTAIIKCHTTLPDLRIEQLFHAINEENKSASSEDSKDENFNKNIMAAIREAQTEYYDLSSYKPIDIKFSCSISQLPDAP